MRVAFRSVVSISFLLLILSAFAFDARAEEPELGQVCEILPEQTPTGTGYVKCCKPVAAQTQTCEDQGYSSKQFVDYKEVGILAEWEDDNGDYHPYVDGNGNQCYELYPCVIGDVMRNAFSDGIKYCTYMPSDDMRYDGVVVDATSSKYRVLNLHMGYIENRKNGEQLFRNDPQDADGIQPAVFAKADAEKVVSLLPTENEINNNKVRSRLREIRFKRFQEKGLVFSGPATFAPAGSLTFATGVHNFTRFIACTSGTTTTERRYAGDWIDDCDYVSGNIWTSTEGTTCVTPKGDGYCLCTKYIPSSRCSVHNIGLWVKDGNNNVKLKYLSPSNSNEDEFLTSSSISFDNKPSVNMYIDEYDDDESGTDVNFDNVDLYADFGGKLLDMGQLRVGLPYKYLCVGGKLPGNTETKTYAHYIMGSNIYKGYYCNNYSGDKYISTNVSLTGEKYIYQAHNNSIIVDHEMCKEEKDKEICYYPEPQIGFVYSIKEFTR